MNLEYNKATSEPMAGKLDALASKYRQLADKYINEESPGKAFIHYLLALQLKPEWKSELRSAFSLTLCSLGTILEHDGRYNDLFTSYEQALTVFPEDEVILNNLGAHLCRLQQLKEALIYFKKALRVNQYYLPAYRNQEITKSHLVERWHFRMLNDSVRNESYCRAISNKIRNGFKTFLDIGTGTGILSIYASKAGATSIYSCDYSPTMISIADNVLQANHLEDSIVLINKLSNELSIPEDIPCRVSAAVTETFDGGLLGEHILQTLIHAWDNLLEPKKSEDEPTIQRVIPHGAVLFITPIENLDIARKNYILHSDRIERRSFTEGLDLTLFYACTFSFEPYDTENLKNLIYKPLGPTQELFEFNFNNVSQLKRFCSGDEDKIFKIEVNQDGHFDALAVWFDLVLDSEITISSSPLWKDRCCWEQAIFPLKKQCFVSKGCSISLSASCEDGLLSVNIDSYNNDNFIASLPQAVIRYLNCETLLLAYVHLFNHIKTMYNEISLLDLSWFPYFSLLVSKSFNSAVYSSSQHLECLDDIIESLGSDINKNKINHQGWSEMLSLLEQPNIKYDVILLDILTTAGEIDEEVISLVPALSKLLTTNGFLLPSTLTIHCMLVFSEELANSSVINPDKDDLNIAEYLNEYKVSHMVDFKLEELTYQEMSTCFEIAVLDMNKIVNEVCIFEKELEINKSGCINAILYWFSLNFTPHIQFSTRSPDSHINQAAVLLDNPMNVEENMRVKLSLYYNSGAMKFEASSLKKSVMT